MPQRDYKDIDTSNIPQTRREPGYDWIPDRFEPPPGIPRREKERLDNLADKDYVNAILRKPIDEIESLMVSEAERRRSFRSTWTFEDIVKGVELAKAGFYFLNSADRAKCAFCSGVIRQWNKGDRPMERHKRYFSFCKYAQGKAPDNIPFDEIGLGSLLVHKTNISLKDSKRLEDSSGTPELGINVNTDPAWPEYRMHQPREQTFGQSWPPEFRHLVPKICDAGFFLAGPGDRCACFFCGGTLEDWTINYDPWAQHAKWYFKCPYLVQCKGGDFIQKIRAMMSEQDRHESENLKYNTSNLDPERTETESVSLKKKKVREHFSFTYAFTKLGYSDEIIIQAYQVNDWNEYEHPSDLLQCMFKIMDREIDPFVHKSEPTEIGSAESKAMKESELKQAIVDGDELTRSQKNLTQKLCLICHHHLAGAVFIPCGCCELCQSCWIENKLPKNCPECSTPVEEALDLDILRKRNELMEAFGSGGKITDPMNDRLNKITTCQLCDQERSGAVLHPCGCFALCISCCTPEKLPENCPACSRQVRGVATLKMLRDDKELLLCITSGRELTTSLKNLLMQKRTCHLCKQGKSEAVYLPCGCVALCTYCYTKEKLPENCPVCFTPVKEARVVLFE